jgi:hypothetical protein
LIYFATLYESSVGGNNVFTLRENSFMFSLSRYIVKKYRQKRMGEAGRYGAGLLFNHEHCII